MLAQLCTEHTFHSCLSDVAAAGNAVGSVVNLSTVVKLNNSCNPGINIAQMTAAVSAVLQAYLVASTPAKITKAPPAYPVAPMISSGMN